MIKSVRLANEARARYASDTKGTLDESRVVLSLGPVGATLFPAQEFDGFYPPPYGPAAYSSSSANRNVFGDDEGELEERSVDALASFHLQRLFVFANDAETWSRIDYVAFETVPLLREITAIKRAMTSLYANSPDLQRKPWWISAVFPDGKYPQHGATSEQVVRTITSDFDNSGAVAVPDGLGINCTRLEFMPRLLDEMTAYLDSRNVRPWLVLCPNGGDVYDPVSRTWKDREIDSAGKGDLWATRLVEIAERYRDRWGGLIIGGCCRTGPKEIEALARKL
jgi:homocysteine S-methyltransferase